ncbi:hypothetical protein DPMN_093926 [Dreissena polymorpha]|uniref:Uncharacterized protein n=1 Tax=Dreissena polymorpha TaxID=45954 RepID=A0A9D4R1G6_DREPO|nr:hypothetical protein DPMN_093926 [Dreissena polymorpha]
MRSHLLSLQPHCMRDAIPYHYSLIVHEIPAPTSTASLYVRSQSPTSTASLYMRSHHLPLQPHHI